MEMNPVVRVARIRAFLDRQIEGRHPRQFSRITEQEAAVLACLEFGSECAILLNQKQTAQLLGSGKRPVGGGKMHKKLKTPAKEKSEASRMSTMLKNLRAKGYVEVRKRINSENWYTITPGGTTVLAAWADRVLGLPQTIETELCKDPGYARLIDTAVEQLRAQLKSKFIAVKHYCPANEFWHGENSCLY